LKTRGEVFFLLTYEKPTPHLMYLQEQYVSIHNPKYPFSGFFTQMVIEQTKKPKNGFWFL
jgi:hypothetical protein